MFPWAFKDGNPQKRIAALELLGTLVLTHCILQKQGKTAAAVRIPVGSDNQGNVFALLNLASKKPHTAAILMELAACWHLATYLENLINGLMTSRTRSTVASLQSSISM